jgi:hypothetical protein
MAVTTDYSNRSVDLFIFQGAKPTGDQFIRPGFGPDSGQVTTGIQKLVQKWTILFFTETGSMEYQPDLGTRFLTVASQGGLRDVMGVKSEFRLAAKTVQNTLTPLEEADPNMPADEKLGSAELTAVSLDKTAGKLNMTVTITSQAGTSHDIILPVPVPIQ